MGFTPFEKTEKIENQKVEKLRDYLTSLHVATDSEELFVLVLRGVDDAIQKVNNDTSTGPKGQ